MARRPSDGAVTVISLEEQLSGWYTLLRRARRPDDLARVYQRLVDTVRSTAELPILSFTISATARYEQLIQLRLNVRRMDLRIAAIVLEDGGTLVTRNSRDFGRIHGLVLEDWST
jgi:tRNA(fMet)-specific endonuclease VapC